MNLFNNESYILKLLIFFYVPTIFWTSGLRKDGLIFLGVAIYLYSFFKILYQKDKSYVKQFIFSIILLFFTRHWLLFTLLPITLVFLILLKLEGKLRYIYAFLLPFFVSIIILIKYLKKILIFKNNQFHQEQGSTRIPLPVLTNSFKQFFFAIPKAIRNNFIDYPSSFKLDKTTFILFNFESLILLISIILLAFFLKKFDYKFKVIIFCFFLLCFLNFLSISLVVPFQRAILRYRTIFEMILITICYLSTDFKKIRGTYKILKTHIVKSILINR